MRALISIIFVLIIAISGCVSEQQQLDGEYRGINNDTIYFQKNYTFLSIEHPGKAKTTVGYWGMYDFNLGQDIVTLKYQTGYIRILKVLNNSQVLHEVDDHRERFEKVLT